MKENIHHIVVWPIKTGLFVATSFSHTREIQTKPDRAPTKLGIHGGSYQNVKKRHAFPVIPIPPSLVCHECCSTDPESYGTEY